MRTELRSRNDFARVAVSLAVALVAIGLTAAAPAQAITRAHADRIALRTLKGLHYSPIVLFRLPGALRAGTRVSIADAGKHGSRRLRQSGWFYWVDLNPENYFEHPGSLVVVARRTGRVELHEPTMTWPLINGRPPRFLRSAHAYDSRSYRVLARGGRATIASARPGTAALSAPAATSAAFPAPTAAAFPAATSAAFPAPAATTGSAPAATTDAARPRSPTSALGGPLATIAAGSGGQCMVVVGPPRNVLNNPLSTLTWGGHLNDADQMAALGQTLGVPVTRAYSLSGIQAALNSAPQQGCTDILLFITGEGSPVPFQIPAGLQPLLGGTRYIGGNSTPNIELDPNGTRIFAPQLARALGTAYAGAPAGAKPSFSLVVQECFGGRLFTSLADAPGVTVIATSSPAGGEAARNAVGGASPWVDGMTDGIQTAEGPKGGIPWTPAVIQAFNGLPPTDDEPQMDVQGKIISKPTKSAPPPSPCQKPNHGGGIDVLLQGEFFGRQWASGEVTASSTDGSAEQTATVGYDYVSVGHFGPWQCGSTTTLRAIPAQGNHFDRWSSPQGLCATTASTCTVPITTAADQVTAFFAPTVYTLTVVNQQPDGRVTGQDGSGGYLNPGIDCGSDPNGPTIQVWTDCTSGAIAQRSETDVTDLRVAADNPGPLQHAYGIASINGCDNSIAATVPVPGNQGGTYVPYLDCFINMTGDRTITVNYKDVG